MAGQTEEGLADREESLALSLFLSHFPFLSGCLASATYSPSSSSSPAAVTTTFSAAASASASAAIVVAADVVLVAVAALRRGHCL